ncbi:MAG: TetR/AcrR family transcriptional regulator [Oscillochloris sp.]|nr:TetR/AcrR family transcriptional regulator [Oscillochloris sp.]
MPRAFSEQERAIIRTRLLQHGRELLAAHGIRRVNVEDLTQAVGISKGAFYLFFASKEELFYAVLRAFEAEYQAELLDALGPPDLLPQQRIRVFIERALHTWQTNPLFKRFGREEYELLARRLPPELLAEGFQDDIEFAGRLLNRWRSEGVAARADANLLAGLMRSLFYVSLHADEFAPAIYTITLERLIGAIARDLTAEF